LPKLKQAAKPEIHDQLWQSLKEFGVPPTAN